MERYQYLLRHKILHQMVWICTSLSCCDMFYSYYRHYWIENATAFNHAYADTGLFVIYGSAHPSKLTDLVVVLTAEMKRMALAVDKVSLNDYTSFILIIIIITRFIEVSM